MSKSEWWKKQITLPNFITLVRLACIPWLAYEIYKTDGYSKLSGTLFILIWLSDYIDGFIARKYNQISDVGKLLDPFVDKLFHVTVAIMMTVVGRVPTWVPVSLFIKDLLLIIGALIMLSHKLILSSKWYGKLTTVLLAAAFAIVFFMPKEYTYLNHYFFILPVLLSYYSLFSYAYQVFYVLKNDLLEIIPQNENGFKDLAI